MSDSWTGFTTFILLEEKPPNGYMCVRGETDKKAANIQAGLFMARTLDEMGKKCPTQVVQALKSRSGCKNSEKMSWMTKIQNMETLTPVLLMKYL